MNIKQLKDNKDTPFVPITAMNAVYKGDKTLTEVLDERLFEKLPKETLFEDYKLLRGPFCSSTINGKGILLIQLPHNKVEKNTYRIILSNNTNTTTIEIAVGKNGEELSKTSAFATDAYVFDNKIQLGENEGRIYLCLGDENTVWENAFTNIEYATISLETENEIFSAEIVSSLSNFLLLDVPLNKGFLVTQDENALEEKLNSHINSAHPHADIFKNKADLVDGKVPESQLPEFKIDEENIEYLNNAVLELQLQLEDLKKLDPRVMELESNVGLVEVALDTLKETVKELKTTENTHYTELTKEASDLKQAITDLELKIKALLEKYLITTISDVPIDYPLVVMYQLEDVLFDNLDDWGFTDTHYAGKAIQKIVKIDVNTDNEVEVYGDVEFSGLEWETKQEGSKVILLCKEKKIALLLFFYEEGGTSEDEVVKIIEEYNSDYVPFMEVTKFQISKWYEAVGRKSFYTRAKIMGFRLFDMETRLEVPVRCTGEKFNIPFTIEVHKSIGTSGVYEVDEGKLVETLRDSGLIPIKKDGKVLYGLVPIFDLTSPLDNCMEIVDYLFEGLMEELSQIYPILELDPSIVLTTNNLQTHGTYEPVFINTGDTEYIRQWGHYTITGETVTFWLETRAQKLGTVTGSSAKVTLPFIQSSIVPRIAVTGSWFNGINVQEGDMVTGYINNSDKGVITLVRNNAQGSGAIPNTALTDGASIILSGTYRRE